MSSHKRGAQDPSAWPTDAQTLDADGQGSTVFVRNLPYDVTDEQFVEYFQDIGPVKHGFVARNRDDHASRGFGFIEYAVPADAISAQEQLNGRHWKDRKLHVEIALNKNDANVRAVQKESILKEKQAQKRQEKKEYHETVRAELRKAKQDLEVETKSDAKSTAASAKLETPEDTLPGSGCTVVVSGFTPDIPQDRILASLRKVAIVESFVYPSPESIPTKYAARVTYPTAKDGKAAVKRFNGKDVRGCIVTATLLEDKALRKASRLMVRNVSPSASEDEIRKLFEGHGKVLELNWPMGPKFHQPFLFINMETIVQADRAIKGLNGTKVQDRPIVVDWALSKDAYEHRQLLEARLKEKQQFQAEIEEATAPKAKAVAAGNSDAMVDTKSKATKAKSTKQSSDSESDSDSDSSSSDSDSDDAGEMEDEDLENEFDAEEDEDADDEIEYEEDEDALEDDDEDSDEMKSNSKKKEFKNDPNSTWNVEAGATIFIRNLSFDTTENDLFNKFSTFGRVRFAKIVKDHLTGRSQGTAFVQFYEVKDAVDVLEKYAGQLDSAAERKAIFKKGKLVKVAKLAVNAIRLDGRDLILSRAVNREKAKELHESGEKKRSDRKREHLAREGLILPGSKAAEGVSSRDMQKRAKAWADKKQKLANPNFVCSDVRLAVMNIPKSWGDNQIRKLFRNTVVDDYKKAGKPTDNVSIKQIKIVRDSDRRDENGIPKSRGFAFIEFTEHEHALHALRALNNNPEAFGSADRRPIIEFAMDDMRKLMMRERYQKQNVQRQQHVNEVREKAEAAALSELQRNSSTEASLAEVIMAATKRRERAESSLKLGAQDHHKRVRQ